jgi:hypothetical protein
MFVNTSRGPPHVTVIAFSLERSAFFTTVTHF